MVRIVALLALIAAIVAPAALAGEPSQLAAVASADGAGTQPPFSVESTANLIADGVTIAGLNVGGMTADEASRAVESGFQQPVIVAFKKKHVPASPEKLGARAYATGAVRRALAAAPGEAVDLVVAIDGAAVRAFVAELNDRFSRPARDATLRRIKGLRPVFSKSKDGVRVDRIAMTKAIVGALRRNERQSIPLTAELVKPKLTPKDFGPVVVIARRSKQLLLYHGDRLRKRFPVAIGLRAYPTPLGRFDIVVKQKNPWWYPPDSDWARGLEAVPPGRGNPLGTRWMGISAPAIGIHGTPDAASIGTAASHGCIRMHMGFAEWLFTQVEVGTPVFIVPR